MTRRGPRLLTVVALLVLGLAACDDNGTVQPPEADSLVGTWALERVRVQPAGGIWVDVTAVVRQYVESSTLAFDDGTFTATAISGETTVTRGGTYGVDAASETVSFDGDDFDEVATLTYAVDDDELTLTADELAALATVLGIDLDELTETLQQQGLTFDWVEVRLQRDE